MSEQEQPKPDEQPPAGVPAPEEIINVESPEELAQLIHANLLGLDANADSQQKEHTRQFLAGTISALQLQNMQLLGYADHIAGWCMRAASIIYKMNTKVGQPFPYSIWCELQTASSPEEAKAIRDRYNAAVIEQARKQQNKIVTLS